MAMNPEIRDSLTGLPGKEEFEQIFDRVVKAQNDHSPVSLAFFDIDDFLKINENNGRAKGDIVIKEIVKLFQSLFPREQGWVCRIGGDEFAVILKRTEKEEAFLRLEKAREAVPRIEAVLDIDPLPAISIGVATYPDDGGTRQEIVRKADDALFRAKSTGRNRVILAREEKKVPKTSHFTQGQLDRLSALSTKEGVGEAELLREGLDDLLKKYSS